MAGFSASTGFEVWYVVAGDGSARAEPTRRWPPGVCTNHRQPSVTYAPRLRGDGDIGELSFIVFVSGVFYDFATEGVKEPTMNPEVLPASVDREVLRDQIQAKYTDVALDPEMGFHFHTGRTLARMLGYSENDIDWLPDEAIESFAGTGNPFLLGRMRQGESVPDLGCGAGIDSLLAARQVGLRGHVTAIDMTPAMLDKAAGAARVRGLTNIEFRQAFAEHLPVEEASIDVVISNGVVNLTPDKEAVLRELWRVLKPGGRLQIADIVVHLPVPQDAKDDIDLWSG
jgi:arsenite methyltransferase